MQKESWTKLLLIRFWEMGNFLVVRNSIGFLLFWSTNSGFFEVLGEKLILEQVEMLRLFPSNSASSKISTYVFCYQNFVAACLNCFESFYLVSKRIFNYLVNELNTSH